MTLHRLHAGDGYEYLTKQVASGDRLRDKTRDLTDYYTDNGTPPGVWMGRGAAALGLSGQVTEPQMQALFGEGLHPNADNIIAAAIADGKTAKQAIEAARIGRMFYEFSTEPSPIRTLHDRNVDRFTAVHRRRPNWDERTILRTDAARDHLTSVLDRDPSRAEIDNALAAEKAGTRKAVAGFDCVFTPAKSISILWGLGSDDVRREIWRCHLEAVREVLEYAESRYAVTRRGADGVMQIDATGLIIAAFTHFDNRSGDMNPHTHAVISGKVLGSDGKWSALDARALYAAAVSLSCRYNATIVGKLKRSMGVQFEERARGRGKQPVHEVVGVGDDMIAEFSRRDAIVARFEQLAAQYRAAHGHDPKLVTQYKLAQQATLETRAQKSLPQTLRQMIAEWDARYRCMFGDGRDGPRFVDELLWAHGHPEALRPFDWDEAAVAVGVDLGSSAAVLAATPSQLEQTIARRLDHYRFESIQARAHAHSALIARFSPEPDDALLEEIRTACRARDRAVYEPGPIAAEVAEIVARRRATWTEANIRSAVEDRLSVCDFIDDDAQRTAVDQVTGLVRDTHSLQLSIDPDPVPAAVARSSGESIFTVTGATRYTSTAVLDAETRLLDAAHESVGELLSAREVDAAIARRQKTEPHRLNPGQVAIAHYLCTVGTRLAVAIGPAGSGKTSAMKAVADAWQASGRSVIALAPSASAARELGASLHTPARTIHKLLAQVSFGAPTGLAPGTMLLVDEAAMAATFDLDALLALAVSHGAVIRCVGDPQQLSAVESGGIIRTISQDTSAPELTQLVRFHDAAEAEATLAVRAGKAKDAWEFYHANGRVTHGMSDQLRSDILADHLADATAGISSVMIAATLRDVSELNAATQTAHLSTGRVRTDHGRIQLSDGHYGYLGDVVITRSNNPKLKILGGIRKGTGINNGDLWFIHRIHHDGSITAAGTTHNGAVLLPANYISEHVELGYATTAHRAQGITVRRARLLLNATLGRALAYVGLTRGSEVNHLYVATDALVDISGDQQPDDPQEPFRCFARVLAREDDNLSAIDVMRDEQAAADHRVRIAYQHAYELLAHARAEYLLDHALPIVFLHESRKSPKYPQLLETIALADTHGLDTGQLVASIATDDYRDLGESLTNAKDTAAMLRARADRWIHKHLPTAPAATATAPIETLNSSAPTCLIDLVAQLNTREVLATVPPERFQALRDAPFPGVCPPVPASFPRIDSELAAYATELRQRIVTEHRDDANSEVLKPDDPIASSVDQHPGTDAARDIRLATASTVEAETLFMTTAYDPFVLIARISATETLSVLPFVCAKTEYPTSWPPASTERLAQMHADYHHYVKELANQHTERRLYIALPVVLYQLAGRSGRWPELLDTIALAAAHGFDTNTLIAAISTDDYQDLGASLLTVPDPARELRDRADAWILQHLNNGQFTHRNSPFRAITDIPYTHRFRPIPDYPGRDECLAELALELRRRIDRADPRNLAPAPMKRPVGPNPTRSASTTSKHSSLRVGRRQVVRPTPPRSRRL